MLKQSRFSFAALVMQCLVCSLLLVCNHVFSQVGASQRDQWELDRLNQENSRLKSTVRDMEVKASALNAPGSSSESTYAGPKGVTTTFYPPVNMELRKQNEILQKMLKNQIDLMERDEKERGQERLKDAEETKRTKESEAKAAKLERERQIREQWQVEKERAEMDKQKQVFAAGKEPDGFLGCRWGTAKSSFRDVELVEEKDGQSIYVRKNEKQSFGPARVERIEYHFLCDYLYRIVIIPVPEDSNAGKFKQEVYARYGPGYKDCWQGSKTYMKLTDQYLIIEGKELHVE